MTSTVQISPELCQTVLYDKINHAAIDVQQLMNAQRYNLALKTYHQILNYAALLSNPEQRQSVITNMLREQRPAFLPLAEIPQPEKDKWIEWLEKLQQFALNLGTNASLATVQHLRQVADISIILGQTDFAAIALTQATQTAPKIPEPHNRASEFVQIASIWLQLPHKAEAQAALTQALAAVEQIQGENPYPRWDSLYAIALQYVQLGEPQRALALIKQLSNEDYANLIRQQVLQDAIKRGDLQLAQTITAQFSGAEHQANGLVAMAVYWATHHQPRRGDRLFAQALQRVAKDEQADRLKSTVIQTYSTSGQLTIALNAAQRLTQDAPKAVALSAIAIAYAKAKQPQQVQQVFALLKSIIESPAAVSSVGYYVGSILEAAINAEQYDFAMAVLNAVNNLADSFWKPTWYPQIVQTALRSHDLDKALEVAKQIPKDLWPEERNARLREVAFAYGIAKQWNRAVEVATQIENTYSTPYQVLTRAELAAMAAPTSSTNAPTPEQFTILIQAAITQAQALELIAQKALALTAIAHAYLRSGNAELTQSFLQQAIQTALPAVNSFDPNDLLTQLTQYLIQQGQYTTAITIAQANPNAYWQQTSYSYIFQAALTSSAFDVALQVLDLDSLPDTQAIKLLAIAKTYLQLERNEDAIALLDRALEVAQKIADPESRMIQVTEYLEVPDESDRAHQYTNLVKLYVALERSDKAQQVVEKIQGTSLRDYLQAWINC